MRDYVIRNYQKGFEQDQVRIGMEAARNWIWPYAYNLEGMLKITGQPDFDPETWHYCFLDNEMVGYMFSRITLSKENNVSSAYMDFPRMMKGHEQAAEILVENSFAILQRKGVSRVEGRVTTMCPGDIPLAEKTGFSIKDWGYKIYYSYEMSRGKLTLPANTAAEIDPDKDLGECAQLAAH